SSTARRSTSAKRSSSGRWRSRWSSTVSDWRVPGFTSTGSKRPDALFGGGGTEPGEDAGVPERMLRASGCRVWDARGREYVDYVMALGAVALGYGHPAVSRAAEQAIAAGVVGPLPPVLEEELADALAMRIPWLEQVRFLKTGAEAVAAAVRLARVATGRDRVLGCGYHGWLAWSQGGEGVPAATRALHAAIPFNDVEGTRRLIREAGDRLALAVGGGRAGVMAGVARTWISSTLAIASVALAAAQATLAVLAHEDVCGHLHRMGTRLLHGLHRLHRKHGDLVTGVGGIAEMCFLHFASESISRDVARGCAARGLLFKRTAYNFLSLAHDEETVDRTLDILDDVLGASSA